MWNVHIIVEHVYNNLGGGVQPHFCPWKNGVGPPPPTICVDQ